MLFILYGMWLLYSQQSYKQKVHSRNGKGTLSSRFSGHATLKLLPAFTTSCFYDFPTPTGEIIDIRTRKIHATQVGPHQYSLSGPHTVLSALNHPCTCLTSPLSDRLGSKAWSGKSTTKCGHWLDPTNGSQHCWKVIYIKKWFIWDLLFLITARFPSYDFAFENKRHLSAIE